MLAQHARNCDLTPSTASAEKPHKVISSALTKSNLAAKASLKKLTLPLIDLGNGDQIQQLEKINAAQSFSSQTLLLSQVI